MVDASLSHQVQRRRPFRLDPAALLLLALALYVGVLIVWPLGRLLAEALAGQGGLIGEVWSSRATRRALANTLESGLWATALATLLGLGFALLLALTDLRGRGTVAFLLLIPLLVPPQITAMAWADLVGPGSPVLGLVGLGPPPGRANPLHSGAGVALVMGVEHMTIVFLAVMAGARQVPRDLIEAARLNGAGPWRTLRAVILPLLRPAILSGAALAFVAAIGNFGVPALLGIPGRYPTLTTLVYQRLNGFGPGVLGEVAAIALLLMLLAGAGLALRGLAARGSRIAVDRVGPSLAPFTLGRWRTPVEIAAWTLAGLLALLPLAALVGTALVPALGVGLSWETATLDNLRLVLFEQDATRRALANSLFLAAIAAVVSAVVALPLGYLAVLRRSGAARALDIVADAPYAIPGIALAIALILVFLKPLPVIGISLYGTLGILAVAYLSRFLSLALRPTAAAFAQIDPALEEAASIAGAGLLRRLARILAPQAAAAAAAGAVLVFINAANELTLSALLWSTGHETLGVTVFSLHYEGNAPAAAAMALVSVAVVLLLAAALARLGRHLPRGTLPWQA